MPGVSAIPARSDARSLVEHRSVCRAGARARGAISAATRSAARACFRSISRCRGGSRWGPRNFEFRWEAFNAFNHQNLANPGTNFTGPTSFGRITGPLNRGYGTGTARQMQFMFRVNF